MHNRVKLAMIVFAVVVLGCSKNGNSKSDKTTPSMTAYFNDTAYNFSVSRIQRIVNSGGYYYFLRGSDSNGKSFSLNIISKTIIPGTFGMGSGDATASAIYYDYGDALVSIAYVHDGLADGFFSCASMVQVNPSGSGKLEITRGAFKNILIEQ